MTGTEIKKNVTVQLEPDLLAKADARTRELDLNRSQYLRRLIRRDLGLLNADMAQLPLLNGKPEHHEVAA